MENGLYKKISDNELMYAQEGIYYPDGSVILVNDYIDKDAPDGWKWFSKRSEAIVYYNIIEIII